MGWHLGQDYAFTILGSLVFYCPAYKWDGPTRKWYCPTCKWDCPTCKLDCPTFKWDKEQIDNE